MELMLRFCDSRVFLNGELRAPVTAFLPVPVVVRARAPHPRDLEELPKLDTPFGQSLA